MEKVFLSDVLKAIKKAYIWNDDISQQILEKEMMKLPSAEKTGCWMLVENPNYSPFDGSSEKIMLCSVCGYKQEQHDFNYCPNCGAKMKGEI